MTLLVPALALATACGVVGALLSKHVQDGHGYAAYFAVGIMTILSWMLTARVSPYNLVVSSTLWTVLYDIAWFGTAICYLGQAAGPKQAIGALVVTGGLILMGI